MLEILALWFLCTKMSELLRKKGWVTTVWMQILVVVTWVGSMLVGSFAYGVYVMLTKGEAALENIGWKAYPVVLISAVAGVGILFAIAAILPQAVPPALKEPQE